MKIIKKQWNYMVIFNSIFEPFAKSQITFICDNDKKAIALGLKHYFLRNIISIKKEINRGNSVIIFKNSFHKPPKALN